MWLLLLFVVLPALELFLLIKVGSRVGVMPTIGLILVTGMLGWMLARSQGASTLRRIRQETQAGRLPAVEMVAGLCLLGAGLLLITPGFLTDAMGFLLLVPPLRRRVARALMSRFKVTVAGAGGISLEDGDPEPSPGATVRQGEVIDLSDRDVRTVKPEEGVSPDASPRAR
jgi:UPF0716 protein FxsA